MFIRQIPIPLHLLVRDCGYPQMSKLLASVRSLEEAHAVHAAPVDVLDLKDPQQGALGALASEVVREIVRLFAGRCSLSATVGDLPPDPEIIAEKVIELADIGVDYTKIGFFDSSYFASCTGALQPLARQHALIGVLFADRLNDFEGPCRLLGSAGFTGVMLDTADKGNGSVCEIVDRQRLQQFVCTAHERGLLCGIAGSLKLADIEPLVSLTPAPHYLGFRTALCQGGRRDNPLCAKAAAEVAEKLRRARDSAGHRGGHRGRASIDDEPMAFARKVLR